MTINEYAVSKGYTGAKYEGIWKQYEVYRPSLDIPEGSKIGYPLRILKFKSRIRLTTCKESIEYLRYKKQHT